MSTSITSPFYLVQWWRSFRRMLLLRFELFLASVVLRSRSSLVMLILWRPLLSVTKRPKLIVSSKVNSKTSGKLMKQSWLLKRTWALVPCNTFVESIFFLFVNLCWSSKKWSYNMFNIFFLINMWSFVAVCLNNCLSMYCTLIIFWKYVNLCMDSPRRSWYPRRSQIYLA